MNGWRKQSLSAGRCFYGIIRDLAAQRRSFPFNELRALAQHITRAGRFPGMKES